MVALAPLSSSSVRRGADGFGAGELSIHTASEPTWVGLRRPERRKTRSSYRRHSSNVYSDPAIKWHGPLKDDEPLEELPKWKLMSRL